MTNPIVIGIDAGGTMTDTILVDHKGHFKIGKAAATPMNEADGFIASAADAADAWGISLDDLFGGVDVVRYSGTGMLNTLLSRTGRRLGLITTKGVEDMILMGRGLQAWSDYSYADRLHAVTHHHPDPLVPRRRTHGVTERIDHFGDVVIPLYEKDVSLATKALIRDKVEAICIMTLFSHVNPSHEKRIAETLHTKLRASCVSAREMARRISASPGVREVGEMVVAIYTPEGDAVALSNGIMVHVHTMSRFIKWMIREGYEADPGIRAGDIFANNDAFIGTVQVPDVMDVIPIFWENELVGWAGAVCHELESGDITPGGDVCLAQERFTEGLFVCAEKIGSNDEIRRDYVIRCERVRPRGVSLPRRSERHHRGKHSDHRRSPVVTAHS